MKSSNSSIVMISQSLCRLVHVLGESVLCVLVDRFFQIHYNDELFCQGV